MYAGKCVWEWRTYAADRTGQDTRAEEDIQTPLQLVATVVHIDEVDAAWE